MIGLVEALRQIKDEDEIAAIREAIQIAERAFTMLRAGLRGSETEKDVADALDAHLRRCGATAASFPADRGGRSQLGSAARPPQCERLGSARTISC